MPRNETAALTVPVVVINADRSTREDAAGRPIFVVDLTVLAPAADPRRHRVEVGVAGPDEAGLHPGAELTAELGPDGDLTALHVNEQAPTPTTEPVASTAPVASTTRSTS